LKDKPGKDREGGNLAAYRKAIALKKKKREEERARRKRGAVPKGYGRGSLEGNAMGEEGETWACAVGKVKRYRAWRVS